MRFESTLSFAVAALMPLASAHYTFSGITVNGTMVGRDWQYVREHTRGYMPTFKEEAATSNDFRCNKDASSGAKTDVLTVSPGDTVGLRQAFGAGGMAHPGPTQIYMSLAPGSVKEYDGSGEWFKVQQSLVCRSQGLPNSFQNDAWCMWKENVIGVTIPETIPDGEYLFRAEHIALHGAHAGKAEFYYACGQIKVQGSAATGLPEGPKVKIPGVYKVDDAPINFSVWAGKMAYPAAPGPDVAAGGQIRGDSNGAEGFKIVTVDGGSSPAPPANSNTPASSAAPSSAAPVSTVAAAATSSAAAGIPRPTFVTSAIATQPTAATSTTISASPSKPTGKSCPAKRRRRSNKKHSRRVLIEE